MKNNEAPSVANAHEKGQMQGVAAVAGGFGAWVPAANPPDSWRLVAWAWRGATQPIYAAGYFGGEKVAPCFRGWKRYDRHPTSAPEFWCDFPALPNT